VENDKSPKAKRPKARSCRRFSPDAKSVKIQKTRSRDPGTENALRPITDELLKMTNVDKTTKSRRRAGTRLGWSQQELDILRRCFGHLNKPPGEDAIRSAKIRYTTLTKHTIPQIKSRAWYLIDKGRYELQHIMNTTSLVHRLFTFALDACYMRICFFY
jgi:hypothetical protein